MINREDLIFATCYQLSQLISSDWEENRPEEVDVAIDVLSVVDEPGEPTNGLPVYGMNMFKLSPSEKEPESVRRGRLKAEYKIAIEFFKRIMHYADSWETTDSDIIKKEILSRIVNYEDERKKLADELPHKCNITL